MPIQNLNFVDNTEVDCASKGNRKMLNNSLTTKCVDTIRLLATDMVEAANSGHPGAAIGCAPIAHVLFSEFMKYAPSDPKWTDRDRFVLSNGHVCALLYTMLHLTGYDLSLEDLKQFRRLGSMTPGHPENFVTPGVEVSTGPLGQGISNAVGMAISEVHLASKFNKPDFKIVDHFTYVLCGDGCLQEGISSEASSLAGHLGLGKLIVLYDDNHITIDGDIDLSFTEDVLKRYEAYNWHVSVVEDANDIQSLVEAIDAAKSVTDKPSIIKVRTVIGQGSLKEGSAAVHGAPLGANDVAQLKSKYNFDPSQSFHIPSDVKEFYLTRKQVGTYEQTAWNLLFESYKENYPDLAMEYSRRMQSTLPLDWAKDLPLYSHNEPKAMATRNHSAEILNILCDRIPEIIGGSADLSESNLPKFKLMTDPFQKTNPLGRFFHFGVREHAMAAVCNGMFAHGGMRPFCATFLNFLGYALGAVRVSALSRFGIIYVMTHDSIGLGEDGPTHQPIEMLESLRSIPNLFVFRPADGNETCGAYQIALNRRSTPSVICLTRQATPTIAGTTPEKVCLGAYVLCDFSKPLEEVIEYKNENGSAESAIALVLVATGSELSLAVKTAEALIQLQEVRGSVRVVSMPSWELFEEQTAEYQISVFPNATPVMSIEASSPHGWQKYAHAPFGIHGYGASAHANDLYQHFGFTVPSLTSRALEVINYYKSSPFPVPSLLHRPKFANMRTADDLHAPQTASEA